MCINESISVHRTQANANIHTVVTLTFRCFFHLGLDYPGVGPEHAYLKDSGRASYVAVTDKQAMEAFFEVSKTEGNYTLLLLYLLH